MLSYLCGPVTAEDFLENYFEKKPCLVQREDRNYYDKLLTWEMIDKVITTLHLSHPQITMADARGGLSKEDYTYPSGLIDAARLYQRYADGSSIILGNLESHLPSMSNLCRSMEADMSQRFQANIYVTPPSSQGLRSHWDSHDVFVLQISGEKQWVIYDTPVELPFRAMRFDPDVDLPKEKTMEFTLKAGEMLYVPRGVMHDASTSDDSHSMHITVGVLNTSWMELVLEAAASVGTQFPDFRQALPPGYTDPNFDRKAAREHFKSLLQKIVEHADFDSALDTFADDLISTRHSLLEGQLEQVTRLPELSLDSRCAPRPALLYRVRKDEEHVTVSCYGGNLTLPIFAAEPLEFALQTDSYTVADLPGDLDDGGKLVLIRRLVREGLVQVAY
jgi:ribosomal protein L16 Arg81 hydroxylase